MPTPKIGGLTLSGSEPLPSILKGTPHLVHPLSHYGADKHNPCRPTTTIEPFYLCTPRGCHAMSLQTGRLILVVGSGPHNTLKVLMPLIFCLPCRIPADGSILRAHNLETCHGHQSGAQ